MNREIRCSHDDNSLPPQPVLSLQHVFTCAAKARSGLFSAFPRRRLVLVCRSTLSACLMRYSNSSNPSFFSAQNSGLIREFKALSSTGVLRLGGNTSEFAYWKPKPDSPEPEHPQVREVVGEPKAQYYAVTPEAVRNLAEFLQATGWNCIYGIGMGTNTPARAAEEAVFVAETLGDRLQYFQIGNEADLFDHHLRDPKTWSAKDVPGRMAHAGACYRSSRARQQSSACLMLRATCHG